MIVIGGSASPKLSAQVASLLGAELVNAEIRHFPDGEPSAASQSPATVTTAIDSIV